MDNKLYLPVNSTRKSFNDYEEITVDKMDKIELVPEESLITIKDNLDEVGKVAFAGCARLNPMQSLVFDTAYKTNNNMLVCAPTGSGKTNVAMLTVLHELKNHFKPNTTKMISSDCSEKFKIIYIAPMKSLATEQTENFNSRLRKLGIKTRELTGDMSLTEREISQTHIIVTTPEKWDVVTRKSKGEVDLLSLVRLMIIDEVHLLQSDRGHVLEALVARTQRYVESSQKMTRIVGLSATLPNYTDVAKFLGVNPDKGLYYFDNRYRPVPLTQTFIGVRALDSNSQAKCMDRICYNLCVHHVTHGKQIMIFVHTRNSTQKVATKLREMIQINNKLELFQPDLAVHSEAVKLMRNAKNKSLGDFFNIGFGIHHAGMIRHDRLLVENLFRTGVLKVLVCTATLAWGVNFPAHAVVIRGTELYDSAAGKYVHIGLLDVTQIFGRAGRPQYDSEGHATIITALSQMDSYLKLLTNQTPIESNFVKHLTDNLNAEVVSGTVSSIEEAMEWIRYTYLNIRLRENPLVYGYDQNDIELDPTMIGIRRRLVTDASKQLDEALMCRFDESTGRIEATDLGRIASHFYINYETITRYNEILNGDLEPPSILSLIGEAAEFKQIKYRAEEANELDDLRRSCYLPIAGGVVETTEGKVNCLLQNYISRAYIKSHSLISDLMYIAQNATRISRGLFEYSLRRGWPMTTLNLLKISKMLELQMWEFQTPLRHFDLPPQVIMRIETGQYSIDRLDSMDASEIAKLVCFPDKMGLTIKDHIAQLPYVIVEGDVKPLKSNLLRLELTMKPEFKWVDKYHGKARQSFWMWVVDEEITNQIYHSEHIKFSKEQVEKGQVQKFVVNVPLVDDTLGDGSMGQRIPNEYVVHVLSDDWSGCDYEFPIQCLKVHLPDEPFGYTKIPQNLNQLPLSVLNNELFINVFRPSEDEMNQQLASTTVRLESFNVLQSQVFYHLYKSDRNALICGPTGSGKTLLADLAALRVFETKTSSQMRHKIVFVSPLAPLANFKYHDWLERLAQRLGKKVIQLNDNTIFSQSEFERADILVSSADKFYIWMTGPEATPNLQKVSLVVLDDLNLLSDERGHSMELVISKLNYLKSINPKIRPRYVGFANTASNSQDVANWLGIKKYGAYNFHPANSRPIQLEIHIIGFSERHYGPRMATMNRPIFKAILTYNLTETTMIFVSSRKQCLSTAFDLVTCLVHQDPTQTMSWLQMDQVSLNSLLMGIHDDDLKFLLEFGIGVMHPSMKFTDRKIVEELYAYNKIQVLICTTNYAWETSLRAHLVIVKGTERYDNEMGKFVDYPPADVTQMLGKAGRPNEDSTGIAILMIRDIYKEFYKKFLYEPFPIESYLMKLDKDHLRNFLQTPRFFKPKTSEKTQTGTSTTEPQQQQREMPNEQQQNNNNHRDQQQQPVKALKSRQVKAIRRQESVAAKKDAMLMFSSSLLARRLFKNPSYYGLNDGKTPEQYLSKYLDANSFLCQENQRDP